VEVGNLFVKLNLDMSGLQRGLEQAKTQVAGLGDRLKSAMKAAEPSSKALAASLAAVGAAAGALGLKAIKMAGQMEQGRIAFTTMLGSAEAADAFLRELYDFAARTPFEIEGLQQSARQLLAFGFHAQEIIPMMEAIGNAVSGLGGGAVEIERVVRALGQMQAKGKVTAEEMMQLAELGIPVWDILAEKIGVSIPEAMDKASKGGISAAEGINAIIEGMNERFPDMMQKQSDSLLGIWSNFEDNVSMILTRIGDDLIETFNFKGKLKSAVEALERLQAIIGEEGLQGLFDQLSTRAEMAIAAIAGAITAALIPAFVALATAIWGAMAPLLPFMAVGAAIAALAYMIYKAWSDNMFGIQDKVKTTGAVISSAFQVAVASIMTAFNKLKEIVLRILQSIMGAVEPLVGVLGKVAPAFESAFQRARDAIKTEGDAAGKEVEIQVARMKEAAASLRTSASEMREVFSSWSTPGATAGFGDFRIKDKLDVASLLGLGTAGEAVSDTMSKVAAAGSKAAQTLQAAWEATSESLKTRLAQVKTAFEIKGNQLDITGNKAQQLRNEIDSLSAQIEVQRQIVEATSAGYEQMKVQKGENSEEAQKLKLKLLEEQKVLSDLEKQLHDTTQALKAHAQEFRDLAAEIDKVERKYNEDLAAALEDYQRKVEEVNRKVREEEQRTTDEYNRAVEERTRALSNFVGLFDEVAGRDVTGETLLANLRGQVSAFENWSENIQALAARGVDEGLIAELREMGPKAGPEIAALNTLTDEQLAEYVTLWRRKNEEARAEAINQLQQQRVEMQQKLMEIRQAANEQLELYRAEWEKKNAEIRKNAEEEMKRIEERFQSIAEAGTKYGVDLMDNFTSGIQSRADRLRSVLEEMAAMVDSYMPHSPAKVGPLRRLNEWGPALVKGLADGIRRGLRMPDFSRAMAGMAALTPAALGPAISHSHSTSNNYGGNVFHVTVTGGSTREQAEDLMRELHRLGVRF
jgi:tape measure domain-containing protein